MILQAFKTSADQVTIRYKLQNQKSCCSLDIS